MKLFGSFIKVLGQSRDDQKLTCSLVLAKKWLTSAGCIFLNPCGSPSLSPASGPSPTRDVTRSGLTKNVAAPAVVKRSRLRNGLVIAQVATSLVLLIVAGLFIRSLSEARAIAPGFEHRNVLAVMLDLGALDYDEARCASFHGQLLERVRALPGVASASIEDCPPLTITMSSTNYWIEDYRDPETEDGRVSDPTNLDAEQWVLSAKAAGMRLILLTAKHHDGFCLWPSAYTEHDVAASNRNQARPGADNGQQVAELVDADVVIRPCLFEFATDARDNVALAGALGRNRDNVSQKPHHLLLILASLFVNRVVIHGS